MRVYSSFHAQITVFVAEDAKLQLNQVNILEELNYGLSLVRIFHCHFNQPARIAGQVVSAEASSLLQLAGWTFRYKVSSTTVRRRGFVFPEIQSKIAYNYSIFHVNNLSKSAMDSCKCRSSVSHCPPRNSINIYLDILLVGLSSSFLLHFSQSRRWSEILINWTWIRSRIPCPPWCPSGDDAEERRRLIIIPHVEGNEHQIMNDLNGPVPGYSDPAEHVLFPVLRTTSPSHSRSTSLPANKTDIALPSA